VNTLFSYNLLINNGNCNSKPKCISVICRLYYRFFWRNRLPLRLVGLNFIFNSKNDSILFLNKLNYFISKCNERKLIHVMQPFIPFKRPEKNFILKNIIYILCLKYINSLKKTISDKIKIPKISKIKL
jgi:hypothetical protein